MVNQYKDCSETELLQLLAAGNKAVFEFIFLKFNADLYRFAFRYTKNKEVAEELVQDVFVYVWNKRAGLQISTSFKSYLFAAVKNRSLNYLKSQFARLHFEDIDTESTHIYYNNTEEALAASELDKFIVQAVGRLPEKCRIIFNLSRQGGLSYKEIAEQLEISPKTVETQMGIALKKLRSSLQVYLGKAIVLLSLMLMP
jgi:RNA polymerase sigma-70 factor (ECF subfamily)